MAACSVAGLDRADSVLAEGSEVAAATGAAAVQARIAVLRADIRNLRGAGNAKALAECEAAVAVLESEGDLDGLAEALTAAGRLRFWLGDIPASHVVLERAITSARHSGNRRTQMRASQGQLSIVDHRVPAGFAPPPHIHQASDEAFVVLDGEFEGFCGDQAWRAGPGSLVYLPHGIPHGFTVSAAGPGRIIVVVSPGGFDQFVAAAGQPTSDLRLPEPVAPDPALLTELAAAHGIQILPPPQR